VNAQLRFDGGARPKNPGHAGIGILVTFDDGSEKKLSRYLGNGITNNEAEYTALIVGVKFAIECGAKYLDIVSDSKLVVNQINGDWKIKKDHVKQLVRQAEDALRGLGENNWSLRWEGRDNNSVTDELCTAAILWGWNQNPFTPDSVKLKRERKCGVTPRVIDPFKCSGSPVKKLLPRNTPPSGSLSERLARLA
jgi:ribonuclease HI